MAIYHGSKTKVLLGAQKVKKVYKGIEKVYSSGNIVTYIVDGKTYGTIEVDEGDSVLNKVSNPTKTNYTFRGWSTTNGGAVVSSLTMGDNPITLYAVFVHVPVRITFVEAGVSTTVEYTYNSTVNRATAPSGATFVGWSTSSAGTSPVKTFVATANATYYRVVKYSDYTVYSKTTGGASVVGGPFTVDATKYLFKISIAIHGGMNGTGAVTKLGFGVYINDEGDGDLEEVYAEISANGSNGSSSKSNITPRPNTYCYIRTVSPDGWGCTGSLTAVGKTVVG